MGLGRREEAPQNSRLELNAGAGSHLRGAGITPKPGSSWLGRDLHFRKKLGIGSLGPAESSGDGVGTPIKLQLDNSWPEAKGTWDAGEARPRVGVATLARASLNRGL